MAMAAAAGAPYFVQKYTEHFLESVDPDLYGETLLERALNLTRDLLQNDHEDDDEAFTFECPHCHEQNADFFTGGYKENVDGETERGRCTVTCTGCKAFFVTAEPSWSEEPTSLVACALPNGIVECRTPLLFIKGVVFFKSKGMFLRRESPASATENELAELTRIIRIITSGENGNDDNGEQPLSDVIGYNTDAWVFDARLCYPCNSFNVSCPATPYPAWHEHGLPPHCDNILIVLENDMTIEMRGG